MPGGRPVSAWSLPPWARSGRRPGRAGRPRLDRARARAGTRPAAGPRAVPGPPVGSHLAAAGRRAHPPGRTAAAERPPPSRARRRPAPRRPAPWRPAPRTRVRRTQERRARVPRTRVRRTRVRRIRVRRTQERRTRVPRTRVRRTRVRRTQERRLRVRRIRVRRTSGHPTPERPRPGTGARRWGVPAGRRRTARPGSGRWRRTGRAPAVADPGGRAHVDRPRFAGRGEADRRTRARRRAPPVGPAGASPAGPPRDAAARTDAPRPSAGRAAAVRVDAPRPSARRDAAGPGGDGPPRRPDAAPPAGSRALVRAGTGGTPARGAVGLRPGRAGTGRDRRRAVPPAGCPGRTRGGPSVGGHPA
ncbi:hypothetical protein GA0074704_4649 [Micromonospora siamensis]|uniref:Uncharacterized protein n=1 Tax=Micromonospora siamensis TaxID=299152 RepID=A0A1C5JLL3_9ACTN|nr:hypothetical protein GA0074704_4649 [Micromonospora siamensis]